MRPIVIDGGAAKQKLSKELGAEEFVSTLKGAIHPHILLDIC